MAINAGTIMAYLDLDTSKYAAQISAASAQAGILGSGTATATQKIQGLGQTMSTVGNMATIGLTLPILGVGLAAGKSAITFESSFAGVQKTVDATDDQFAMLRESLLSMSESIPTSASDLAKIMEMAGQLGVGVSDLQKFTRVIADLGVATNLTGEEGATMLAQYANVTGMDLNNIDRLGSVIVALGNSTATTEKDITEMAQRLSGAADVVGLTDAQTMGLSATMTSLGINAEAGGSAMSRTISTMAQAVAGGGKELTAFAKASGMSAKDFSAAFKGNPIDAIKALVGGLSTVKDAGGDVYAVLDTLGLSDMRITDTLLRMAGAEDNLTANIETANGAWAENNALTAEASKRYETTESKLALAKNSIDNMLTSLGDALLPTIKDGADTVSDLAQSFSSMDDSSKQTAITLAGVAAAAGPVTKILGGLIGLFTGPLGVVAAVGLGAVGIGLLVNHIDELNEAAVDDDLKNQFGAITLSATDLDAIMAKGFTAPTINYEAVKTAQTEIVTTVTDINSWSAPDCCAKTRVRKCRLSA